MGIFDIIELKNHIQAIGEYVFYITDVCQDRSNLSREIVQSMDFIRDHLKKMHEVLDKLEK